MDRYDKLNSYFLEKERKRLDALSKDNAGGLPEMSAAEVKLSCLENNGYENPILNEKLFLHFRGFKKIDNLAPYTACKALWLDSNGLDTIENLDALAQLRCLYMSKNLIARVDGLACLQELVILDLSYNRLTHLANLSCCPKLQTLNVARNCLATPVRPRLDEAPTFYIQAHQPPPTPSSRCVAPAWKHRPTPTPTVINPFLTHTLFTAQDALAHLVECPALNNVDVTNNKLEADEGFMEVSRALFYPRPPPYHSISPPTHTYTPCHHGGEPSPF